MRPALGILASVLVVLFLLGCETPAEERARFIAHAKATCEEYGFTPGSDPFAECVQRNVEGRYDRMYEALNDQLDNMSESFKAPSQDPYGARPY